MNKIKIIFYYLFIITFFSSCHLPPDHLAANASLKNSGKKINKEGFASYRVFGKDYCVMQSSKNYEQVGIASWYGRQFHKKRTSSGERYNMFKMTAAHKTLPLDSRVLVTNLHNGKKVIVKVNDRGPFVSNRLIDLSYMAAKKLGILGLGTAAVNVKALPTDAA